jgi:hypothetical protein
VGLVFGREEGLGLWGDFVGTRLNHML